MAVLGVEFGSTRVKAVLISRENAVLAVGTHEWENKLEGGLWTYELAAVWTALASSVEKVRKAAPPGEVVEAVGISAMMHGYLAFGRQGELLTPFRTWRNTTTQEAAKELSEAFRFNIPQRWSAAHLYQAILNGEEHVRGIDFLTTLAGYVHWGLTGERCLGVGDASGMFPLCGGDYHAAMLAKFEQMAAHKGVFLQLRSVLPHILCAGEEAGRLTEKGALLLDPSGWIRPGTPLCPPEGDAGTGMTATNSIAPLTGNVSAGTSIFAMVVLEKPIAGVYPEIDVVTTPTGSPVAMVHCNNCTSDLDAWVGLFAQALETAGTKVEPSRLYELLYRAALSPQAAADAGGLLHYSYYGGEQITQVATGVPLFLRRANSELCLANLFRSLLFSSVATLKLGMDILTGKEQVKIERLQGHGGLFKTRRIAQSVLASALGVPIRVSETAGEGGAWGIAVLAGYCVWRQSDEGLEQYLATHVFTREESTCEEPNPSDAAGFASYMERYEKGMATERAAAAIFQTGREGAL